MLIYEWKLILYGVQGDAAFTQRHRILIFIDSFFHFGLSIFVILCLSLFQMLIYAWKLILYGVQGDAAFTQRRRILTLALASILLSEAFFGLFPPLVPPILRYGLNLSDDVATCTTTILLGARSIYGCLVLLLYI